MTPSDPQPPMTRTIPLPWRSAWIGWGLAIVFLAIGVPLFMRMPPWCDITLYDVAAHAIMSGGTHYKDVFDTNLPGFVWLLVGVRRTLGDSTEALRVVDLGVVATTVVFLVGFARRAGATPASIAWLVAGAAFFYPFTSEFNHAQRDVWMLLPALVATWLRLRRVERRRLGFWPAVCEGAIWGCAIWIKPHALIPVAGVWLATIYRLARTSDRFWRAALQDALGYLLGGGSIGLLGLGWLAATGTFQPFLDVFRKWNNVYAQAMWDELPGRLSVELSYFPPYSLLLPWPLAVALFNLFDAGGWVSRHLPHWLYAREESADVRFARLLLSTLFLAWVFQAAFFQRMFHYVHVPEILLMLAVAAANRWAVAATGMAYAAVCGAIWLTADHTPALDRDLKVIVPSWTDQWITVPRHPLAMPERLARWPDCFRTDPSDRAYRERQEAVALLPGTFASIDPVEIGEVADYFRSVGAKEGEVLCWHDAPHALYLELGHRPPFRFMHLSTALLSLETYERMKIELIKALRKPDPQVKYIVSDLKRVFMFSPDSVRGYWSVPGPGGTDLLPPVTAQQCREVFPMDQPCVFRSGGGRGRFIVHRYEKPFGPYDSCTVPEWPEETAK